MCQPLYHALGIHIFTGGCKGEEKDNHNKYRNRSISRVLGLVKRKYLGHGHKHISQKEWHLRSFLFQYW